MTDPLQRAEVNAATCEVEAERIGLTIARYYATLRANGVDEEAAWPLVVDANDCLWRAYAFAGAIEAISDGE